MRKYLILSCLTLALMANEPIQPIPSSIPYDKAKAALGKVLFFDPSLSKDGKVSCATCHKMEHGGADDKPVSIGVFGKKGRMNSPTVFNAVFNFRQFWNGRAKDLVEQIDGPIHNPVEMGLTTQELLHKLRHNTYYRTAFTKIYGKGGITYAHFKEAIAEFEKTLITPKSKFDRFLQGKAKLSVQEAKGYELFKTLGCITCHNGINIGGNSFQKLGTFIPYKGYAGDDRYAITHDPKDKYVYKVPTLRNVALTAPYFHDGSVPNLAQAIKKMAYYNLGVVLTSKQRVAIEAFLRTLTGEVTQHATHPTQ